jgi:hypothetical protein
MRSLFVSFTLFLFAVIANASCPGMKGDAALRCACYDFAGPLPNEAKSCVSNSDCKVISGPCADWVAVNSVHAEKMKRENRLPKNRLPKLKLPPKPVAKCVGLICTAR